MPFVFELRVAKKRGRAQRKGKSGRQNNKDFFASEAAAAADANCSALIHYFEVGGRKKKIKSVTDQVGEGEGGGKDAFPPAEQT